MKRHPTLLSSCARAATASEARFRVDYPNSRSRDTRIFALDRGALRILERISAEPWHGAHFLNYEKKAVATLNGSEATIAPLDGGRTTLEEELQNADVAIMVATTGEGAEGASFIGDACWIRRIMTAGLAVGVGADVGEAVTALRPLASVLVVSSDQDYVPDVLRALRS